jgi:hypothetical protein
MDEGKNSHHSQFFFMCSIILGTNSSYSSFVYCLLRIQYEVSRNQIHAKIFEELMQESEYRTSFQFEITREKIVLKLSFTDMSSNNVEHLVHVLSQSKISSALAH